MALVIPAALFGAALFLLFKAFVQWRVALVPAIVVNYLVACLVGLAFSRPWAVEGISLLWAPAAVQGGLFIVLFRLIGLAAQRAGIAATTVASKMSLALTVLLTVMIFKETPSALAWAGIALAVAGVSLSSWGGSMQGGTGRWLLPVIFVASACSDVLLDAAQRTRVGPATEAVFTTLIFGFAAVFGAAWLAFRKNRKALMDRRTWAGGVLLGCVNFGSIHFLVLALSRGGLPASLVFPLLNIGVILLGTVAARALFRERLRAVQWAGLACSLIALGLIMASQA